MGPTRVASKAGFAKTGLSNNISKQKQTIRKL